MSILPRHNAPAIRPGTYIPALLLILLALFSLVSSGFAATLTVTNANDSGAGSLRGALAAAAAGDTVTFDAGAFPTGGNTVISLTGGRLAVNKDLIIQGPGVGRVTISDSSDGIFSVMGNSTAKSNVYMSGLTLANGNGASGISNGNGGGIYTFAANLTLTGCVLSGNTANGGGGAISINGSTVSLTGCTLSGNTANGGGGAISSNGSSTVSLTNCTLVGNRAAVGGLGGGINNNGTLLTLTNCTLVGNTAGSDQSPSGHGGGIYSTSGATVQSCLIAGNVATGGGADVFGSFTSGGSNLIGDGGAAADGFTGPHDRVGVDPKIDPKGLQNNGGPTPTVAVLAGSPAIGGDYADATTTDQRGVARTAPHHTIGAFEYNSFHTHVLWTNTSGQVSLWNYDTIAGSFAHSEYGPYAGWTAKSIADGPDGKTRVLWENADRTTSLWSLDNTSGVFTNHEFGPYPGWTAGGVSVGPDNTTHVLWTNTSGQLSLWNYDTTAGSFAHSEYGPYAGWTAKSIADGPDGKTRVLWENSDRTTSLWSLDNTSGVFTNHEFGPYPGWTAIAISAGP